MRRVALSLLSVLFLLLSVFLSSRPNVTGALANRDERHWIKITFGLDKKTADWDGNLAIQNGNILSLENWGFEKDHSFNATERTWTCSTFVNNVREQSTYAEPFRGLLVELESEPNTVLHVNTKQGYIRVTISELETGKPTLYLDGRASAELLGTGQPLFGDQGFHSELNETQNEEDYPSITVDAAGQRWVAWIGYDDHGKQDQLCTLNLDDPTAKVEMLDAGRLQSSPRILTDGDGLLWLIWSAPVGDNWEIFSSRHGKKGWTKPATITTATGSDFHLASTTGPDGEIWLAWQSFRKGNGDIYAKRRMNGKWSDDVAVTSNSANQWQPAISIDPAGKAWIAYDSYENGNYDVFLSNLEFDKSGEAILGNVIPVAASEEFEAHASVEATEEGTVWVAFDAAGPGWGKDLVSGYTDYQGEYHEPLHATRRLELRAYSDGQLYQPKEKLPQKLDTLRPTNVMHKYMGEVKRFYDLPQLARDATGRLWMFFRLNRQGYAEDPIAALWEVYATTFVNGEWLEPILLPQSAGRQDQQIDVAVVTSKKSSTKNDQKKSAVPGFYCAWSAGHHMNDVRQTVRVGKLPNVSSQTATPPLEKIEINRPVKNLDKPIRSWKMQHKGREYEVYFGDMHRHTEISWCYPTVDGSLVDAHRYAMDAAQLDFFVVTDHTRDTDPYPWWQTQKAVDLFHVPGKLTTIYGYERSNDTPGGGHRNVFFLKRDWPVYRSDHHYKHIGKSPVNRNDPVSALYPKLRGKDAFTAAHTPVYSPKEMRGTWSYQDREVEPLVEVFQGFRRDYLRPEGRVLEEASIWYALSRGYRLGFIASSDHVSTHKSFACVWAADSSREELFKALKSRRTYAATDKILLEVRMGSAVMGEETRVMGKPKISVRVKATAEIDEIQIVRNRKVISTTNPAAKDVTLAFVDEEYDGGPAWYYVYIHQTDGNRAWGSPIWVE